MVVQESDNNNKNIKALIFDCDGTLVNSMEFFYEGWKAGPQ